ncbi:alkene reductase [Chitinimonas lacunae]|uniref:Alkene reductase n=1 Tax=Chitinimonas lacunae TaxID=1963018 RepID=A0ABV8MVS3_9NEIS
MDPLFTPLELSLFTLKNRLVMAPMTRSRADEDGVPTEWVAPYYTQRAGAGLIITEGVYPARIGKGYVRTPGIDSPAQREAWRTVSDSVHQAGGLVFMQLMHCGRLAHPALNGGETPVAPSPIAAQATVWTDQGPVPAVVPRALDRAGIAEVIGQYADATAAALAAGFDGVELHAASGYLPEQFLSSNANQRDDEYGGSASNRVRFVLALLDAMIAVAGPGRVGIKIAPEMGFNDMVDRDPTETYGRLIDGLNERPLAYLHVMNSPNASADYHALLRPVYQGVYLAGGGLGRETAAALLARHGADAVVFGSLFLANPDLPQRFARGATLNVPRRESFYSPGPVGYLDYPVLAG